MIKHNDIEFCLNPIKPKKPTTLRVESTRAVLTCASNCRNVLAVIWYYVKRDGDKKILIHNKAKIKRGTTKFDQIGLFTNGTTARVRRDRGNVNLEINQLTQRQAGKYKCEVVQTTENPACPNVQETILEVISGNI